MILACLLFVTLKIHTCVSIIKNPNHKHSYIFIRLNKICRGLNKHKCLLTFSSRTEKDKRRDAMFSRSGVFKLGAEETQSVPQRSRAGRLQEHSTHTQFPSAILNVRNIQAMKVLPLPPNYTSRRR